MKENSFKRKKLDKITSEILNCIFCKKNKKDFLVVGEGSVESEVVFVGEAPGKEEIKTGKPFIGRAGKVLHYFIDQIGLSENKIYITSVVKYLPPYVTPKNKDIEHGRVHLKKQLMIISPKIVVLLGKTAYKGIFGDEISVLKEHGNFYVEDDQIFFLTYHPAAPLYNPSVKKLVMQDFKKLQKYCLKNDFKKEFSTLLSTCQTNEKSL